MLELKKLIDEAKHDDLITCPKCRFYLQPDAKQCQCGWENPLSRLPIESLDDYNDDPQCEHLLYPCYVPVREYLIYHPKDRVKLLWKEKAGDRVKVGKCKLCDWVTPRLVPKNTHSNAKIQHFRKQRIRRFGR